MGIKAYALWLAAGEPDGADFSGEARDWIQRELSGGATLQVRALVAPRPRSRYLHNVSVSVVRRVHIE